MSLRRDARKLLAEFRQRYGSAPDATQEQACRRAAELITLAASLRAKAIDGAGVDLSELNRIETLANEATASLPPATAHVVSTLEVELVGTDARQAQLRDENAALREENAGLKAAMARIGATEPRGESEGLASAPEPVASASPSRASPSPNVIPLETADQRRARIIAENRRKAGDRPMPLSQRSAFTESGMLSGEGRFPFDFPFRGGW
jgi:hypothetical protein